MIIETIEQLPPAQLGTNLAEVGTDCISRQQAIVTAVNAAINWHKLANPQYSIAYCIGEAARQLPPIQPDNGLQSLADEIASFKRCVKSENSDYLTGYLCALSAVEGMIAERREATT